MDFLLTMYRECNEHLRHTDSKRDQLLMFYAAIVALFFNARKELNDQLWMPALVALILFGLFIFGACVWYWRWHFIYNKTVFVLRSLIISHQWDQAWRPDYEEINREWNRYCGSLGPRTEFWILTALAVISALPVYVAANELLTSWTWVGPCPLAALCTLVLLAPLSVLSALTAYIALKEVLTSCSWLWPLLASLAYVALLLGGAWCCLRKAENNSPEASWFFRCLEKSEAERGKRKPG